MPLSDTADLTLFYAPQTRAFMGLWLLEELGQPYRIELVDLSKGEHKGERLTRHNPMGKVPTVLDGDVPVSETGAIVTYLVDKYAPDRLGPRPDDPTRAAYLRWLFFGGGVIEPSFGEKFFKWEVPSRAVGWGSFDDMLRTVSARVSERPWLAGEHFSGADLYVASLLRYGLMFGVIEKDGPVPDYVGRCEDRPGFRTARAIEDDYVKRRETTQA